MIYFIVTDIFGAYDALTGVLDMAKFEKDNPNHTLVSLGNLLDFGPNPKECLEYIMSIEPSRRILIQGSHEVDMRAAIERGNFIDTDTNNGLISMVKNLTGTTDEDVLMGLLKDNQLIKDYLDVLQPYYETENAIFVSGWIPCYHFKHIYDDKYNYLFERRWRDATDQAWEDATRLNGMEAWNKGIYDQKKTIICGNYPAPWGHYNLHGKGGDFAATGGCNCPGCVALRDDMAVVMNDPASQEPPIYDPFYDTGIIGLNGCVLYGGMANTITWDDEPIEGMPVKTKSEPTKKISKFIKK